MHYDYAKYSASLSLSVLYLYLQFISVLENPILPLNWISVKKKNQKAKSKMVCQPLEKAKPKYRKGLWSPEEDIKLRNHILTHGHSCWSTVPIKAGRFLFSSLFECLWSFVTHVSSIFLMCNLQRSIVLGSYAVLSLFCGDFLGFLE